MNLSELAETGLVPDARLRIGIRRLLSRRLQAVSPATASERAQYVERFTEQLRNSPLAVATDTANRQHYEVPVEMFEQMRNYELLLRRVAEWRTADGGRRTADGGRLTADG